MNLDIAKLITNGEEYKKLNFIKNKQQEPYLIKNYSQNWKAQKEWDFEFLLKLDPESIVNTVVGNAAAGEKQIIPMTLKTYIENIKNENSNEYLTTFHLFKRYPHLKKHVSINDIKKNSVLQHLLAWIAPKGAITGFHQDWSENINVQIKGSKVFYLVSPKFDDFMYISSKFERISKTSLVDLKNVDFKKFPLFSNVEIKKFILKPSDAIYIPYGWWHFVESLEPSINISVHYWEIKDLLKKLPLELIKVFFHDLGLYKKHNCACHQIKNNKFIKRG